MLGIELPRTGNVPVHGFAPMATVRECTLVCPCYVVVHAWFPGGALVVQTGLRAVLCCWRAVGVFTDGIARGVDCGWLHGVAVLYNCIRQGRVSGAFGFECQRWSVWSRRETWDWSQVSVSARPSVHGRLRGVVAARAAGWLPVRAWREKRLCARLRPWWYRRCGTVGCCGWRRVRGSYRARECLCPA